MPMRNIGLIEYFLKEGRMEFPLFIKEAFA
jgi:hypothetical protein